ncbi:hypothetical protein SAMN05421866_0038 [Chryseobacterium oranimense]|uniref:Uncharacterized protein n=1 Tax=Chryseobacterium oranimense TaxID=421058 RepID=A0A1M5X7S1_9FLAO|nr:hypothetical protein [Chryseobacterium oranimense]SHH95887.1 hypothetical protein SAMN05421866_0038 [Chryseobacterium oranimense]
MQKFWYHSPVRFYKTMEELEDMTNPQNTQYYGHKNPYPLEYNSYHRFLIPNYQNEVPEDKELQLWIVGDEEIRIPCEFGIYQNKLVRVSFICYEIYLSGRFEIRTEDGDVLFYSNCVQFVDSEDDEGRKFIRIATKHTYAKNIFPFANQQHDWMVTSLPGYCLGEFSVDEDVDSGQSGNLETTVINDALLEESVSYLFQIEGDNNIMTFISVHSVNNDFYIDGTKRTRKEKPEIGDNSAWITMKFSNVKDKNGLNIILDESKIFDDVIKKALSNDLKTVLYTYNNNKNAIPTG